MVQFTEASGVDVLYGVFLLGDLMLSQYDLAEAALSNILYLPVVL